VILRLQFTARDGDSAFLNTVQTAQGTQLNDMMLYAGQTRLYQGYNMRQQFHNEWWTLLSASSVAVTIGLQQLPYWRQENSPIIDSATWFVTPHSGPSQTPTLSVNSTPIKLGVSPIFGSGVLQGSSQIVAIGTAFTLAATNTASLWDVNVLIHYKITG
jgi:hypothetical protein